VKAPAARRTADEGSVLVLGIGLVVVLLLTVGAGTDAARLFLARRSLSSVADGAALRGAHDLDQATLYRAGAAGVLPLSERRVRDDVVAYVRAESSANGLRGVRVTGVTVRDGDVRVDLAMTETSPVLGPLTGSGDGVLVTATASARTAVR
jgi:Putative Flp pilus-assembly TadE/G-like